MTQALQVFNFKGADVRTVLIDGEPWWVAKDVCDVLGLKDSESACRKLRPHEKVAQSLRTPGGNQAMTIIRESGLYKLILKSPKVGPEFEDWLFGEVLPQIRKTGSYSVSTQQPSVDAYLAPIGNAIAQVTTFLGGHIAEVKQVAEQAHAAAEEAKAQAAKATHDFNAYGRLQDLYAAAVEAWVTDGVRMGVWPNRTTAFGKIYGKAKTKWCSKKYMNADQLREAIPWAQSEHQKLLSGGPTSQTVIEFQRQAV